MTLTFKSPITCLKNLSDDYNEKNYWEKIKSIIPVLLKLWSMLYLFNSDPHRIK